MAGQPRAFKTGEEFINAVDEYILYCINNKRFPNIAGFAVFKDGKIKNKRITRDTYYQQKEYYPKEFNMVEQILEDNVLQDNTYRAQLYLKNKFGYSDSQRIESVNTNLNLNKEVDSMTIEEIEAEIRKLEKK
jgi:phosphorylcholine metabolism protein LicD